MTTIKIQTPVFYKGGFSKPLLQLLAFDKGTQNFSTTTVSGAAQHVLSIKDFDPTRAVFTKELYTKDMGDEFEAYKARSLDSIKVINYFTEIGIDYTLELITERPTVAGVDWIDSPPAVTV